MVRTSDARMSGTASGMVVLHVSPESALGGPLALVKSGAIISLDAHWPWRCRTMGRTAPRHLRAAAPL
ncbi:MAG: dihydroxy-acid dehydratase [Devosia sp.]|nr:dihydroxy-acid dehydratase [Devosia sp.]